MHAFAPIMLPTVLLFSPIRQPSLCPVQETDVAQVVKAIKDSPSCYLAAETARECAHGDSTDVKFFPAAIRMCMKDFKNITTSDQAIYDRLVGECSKKYDGLSDELESLRVHCVLKIAELFSSIYRASL